MSARTAFLFLLLPAIALLHGTVHGAPSQWQTQLPSEIYPGLQEKSDDEIALAGLAALYPGRILSQQPPEPAPVSSEKKPTQATLVGNITYWRFYQISSALPVTATPPRALIVDLRFLQTSPAQIMDCLNFSAQVFGSIPRLKTIGNYPLPAPSLAIAEKVAEKIVVLINHKTAGPIEAILADLQARGKIILIGTASAGKTALYQPLAGHSGWWHATGELQTESNPVSYLGTGVVPQMRVAILPENDLVAWQWIERGASPETVLRRSLPRGNSSAEQTADEESQGADLILRRGHEILAVFQTWENLKRPFN